MDARLRRAVLIVALLQPRLLRRGVRRGADQWQPHPRGLSAHNGAGANVAVIGAGLVTAVLWRSA